MAEASATTKNREPIVNVTLRGARVTNAFRENLFDAANRAGITPNEFVLQAVAEKLKASGRQFSGVFRANDLSTLNGGMGI